MPAEDLKFGLVSPEGNYVEAKNKADIQSYVDMGYQSARVSEIKHEELKKAYNDTWAGPVAAIGQGIVQGIPGLNAGIMGLQAAFGDNDSANEYAQQQQILSEAHPALNTFGNMVGTVATAGAIGAGTGATTLAQMASGVAGNVAIDVGQKVNEAALMHITEPGGEEKIMDHLGHDLFIDALTGAGGPLAGKALSKAFKTFGGLSKALSDQQLKQAFGASSKFNALAQQARTTDWGSLMDDNKLWGLSGKEAAEQLAPKLEQLSEQYNEIKGLKFRQGPQEAGAMVAQLGDILGDSHPELATKLTAQMMEYGNAPTVGELHSLRQQLSKGIEWNELSTAEQVLKQQPKLDAYELIGNNLRDTLRKNAPEMADKWSLIDKDFSRLTVLKNGIENTTTSLKDLASKRAPWQVAFMGSALGIPGISHVYSTYALSRNVLDAVRNGNLAGPAKALAAQFDSWADKMAKATAAGLYGAAAEASHLMHSDAKSADDYDLHAAQVRYGMKDPTRTMSKMAEVAQKAGLPDDLAIPITMRARVKQQYLAAQLPQNPDPRFGGGVPSGFRPSHEFRQKWIGQVNTANDFTYGLLNPTTENIAVMKTVWPEALASAQNTILQSFQRNTEIPLEGQVWASRVMGYPIGGLMSPTFYNQLTQARQINAQKAQQSAKPQQSGGSGNSGSDSVNNMTSLQKLQSNNG